jgi:hypothetical protein
MIFEIVVVAVVIAVAYMVHKHITLATVVADVKADVTQLKLDVSTELTKLKPAAVETAVVDAVKKV